MFLRSLSTFCARAVLAKRSIRDTAFTTKQNAKLAALSVQFSTLRVYEDDDESTLQKRQFTGSQTNNNFGNRTFNSPSVNRSGDFRYNFAKKYEETPDWKPFKKDFYQPLDVIDAKVDIDEFLSKHQITVKGPAPNPIMSFDEIALPDNVSNELKKREFTNPTPIQAQGWPIALSGHNLVGIAQTGSGKTLAYILPAIVHINNQEKLSRGDGPIVLVLAPTRELAQQIQQVANQYGASSHVRNACVFGGTGRMPQAHDLQRGR